MADREIKVKLQNARDVKSNWERNDPVLLDGEIGVVFDATDDPNQVRLKIGNGTSKFSELPYWEDPTKIAILEAGVPNGIATLDENGLIPLSQLPASIGGEAPPVAIIEKIPEQLGKLVYNGLDQMPVWRYYDPDAFIIGGRISATDAGEYTTIFQPATGYAWADMTQSPVFCTWTIEKCPIESIPTLLSDLVYDGTAQTPEWDMLEGSLLFFGDLQGTDAGEYQTTFVPSPNHCWGDGVLGKGEAV